MAIENLLTATEKWSCAAQLTKTFMELDHNHKDKLAIRITGFAVLIFASAVDTFVHMTLAGKKVIVGVVISFPMTLMGKSVGRNHQFSSGLIHLIFTVESAFNIAILPFVYFFEPEAAYRFMYSRLNNQYRCEQEMKQLGIGIRHRKETHDQVEDEDSDIAEEKLVVRNRLSNPAEVVELDVPPPPPPPPPLVLPPPSSPFKSNAEQAKPKPTDPVTPGSRTHVSGSRSSAGGIAVTPNQIQNVHGNLRHLHTILEKPITLSEVEEFQFIKLNKKDQEIIDSENIEALNKIVKDYTIQLQIEQERLDNLESQNIVVHPKMKDQLQAEIANVKKDVAYYRYVIKKANTEKEHEILKQVPKKAKKGILDNLVDAMDKRASVIRPQEESDSEDDAENDDWL